MQSTGTASSGCGVSSFLSCCCHTSRCCAWNAVCQRLTAYKSLCKDGLLYLQANELELALDVYNQLLREGCQPNLVTYNILIDIYGKMGSWQEAVQVLDALEGQVSCVPDIYQK